MLKELELFIGKRGVRRAVVETAMAATSAFSADELYAMTRRRQPNIGRATIYRTLRLLCDRKFFRQSTLRDGAHVYQRSDHPPSILWICDDCSSIRTLVDDQISKTLLDCGEKSGLCPLATSIEVRFRCEQKHSHGTCVNESLNSGPSSKRCASIWGSVAEP